MNPERTTALCHVTTVPMSLTFLRGQVGYMQARGFRVSAVSSPGLELDEFGRENGAFVAALPMPRSITPGRDLWTVWRMTRVLRRIRPEIVHSHTPKGGLLGMLSAVAARVPVRIYHMRGLPLMGASGAKRRLLWWTEWVSCALAHRVICVSHSLREVALAEGLCAPEKIVVVAGGSGQGVDSAGRFDPANLPSGVREDTRARFNIPADAPVAGFVGRLVRDKGVVELWEAWRTLREAHPTLHLLLVGPFEPQDPVPPAVREGLEADPRVHLAGMDWNTPALYAAMDLLVLPTYREGFPNVPLEAAAMGLPVVATRIPGCVDAVVEGVTGTLVPVRDAATLAKAVGAYVADPELRRAHGTAGRARVERDFRREVIWAGILAEYTRLLDARRRRSPVPMSRAAETRP
ncbi:MAG TPA: glycosyltransferase family 4 protein [Longimicrobium sp.]|nr:glycosyltransferase family 4 protein [Longimicrobium sp.]